MRLRDTESIEDKYLRDRALYNEQRKDNPLIISIILILCLVLGLYAYRLNIINTGSGSGNPFMCEACKGLGHACSEHKDFDSHEYLTNLVAKAVESYYQTETEIDQQYALYGVGNTYNTECDFCNKEQSECYGCKSNRLTIYDKLNSVEKSAGLRSWLCDDCYAAGKVECSMCKEKFIKLTMNLISQGSEIDM